MKNKQIINDNKKYLDVITMKIYNNIFKLDTKLLQQHELQCFKELISRKDYNELDYLIDKYYILKDTLLERGVNLD